MSDAGIDHEISPDGSTPADATPADAWASTRLQVGVTSSFNKVFFDAPHDFNGKMGGAGAEIFMARNEYEAFQLVLFPGQNLTQVTVEVGALARRGGDETIPADDVEVNVVGYVNLTETKVATSRAGWHPDPLLPAQPLDLDKDVLQPYLVTVHARPETAAGNYLGTLTIKVDGVVEGQLPVEVMVWNFTLPKTPVFKSASLPDWSVINGMWPGNNFTAQEKKDHFLELADLGFKNRLPPVFFLANGLSSWNWSGDGNTSYGYPTHDTVDGKKVFNPERVDELVTYMLDKGANHFFIAVTSDIFEIASKVDARKATLKQYLSDYQAHLNAKGWTKLAYIYNVDEPWGAAVQHAKDTYTLIRQEVGADIAIMQNTNQDNDTIVGSLLGFFDTLDINLGHYQINDIDGYRAKHPEQLRELWWNVNIWPATHPNLFLEYPLVDARIIGPMSYKFKVQGFEYWQLLSKTSIDNYYPLPRDEIRVRWNIKKQSLDGCLIYPGEGFAIYSSMRFESFRDGMEDQEYLYLLQQRDPSNPLLDVEIVTDLTNYSTDPDDYLAYRKQLGEALAQTETR